MKVLFHGSVKDHTSGDNALELSGARSLRILIDELGQHFGEEFRQFLLGDETCFFLVNGSGIMTTGGLDTPLNDGDTVEVLPYVDGG